jgi:methyltransferase (TIGR00027 family)
MSSQHDPRSIQETADALVVIRANEALAGPFGIVDPYAHYFVTDAGKRMVEMAESVDPCYVAFNLVRYRYFTERIREATARYRQLLFLGAGYDTRAISMPEFGSGSVEVFEVDYPEKLASKQLILTQAGVPVPPYVRYVPMNLAQPGLLRHLCDLGFRPSEPTLVLMEGLVFFLAAETTMQLLDPGTLELATGSTVIFDYWSNERINRLNQRVEERLGRQLFSRFPFPDLPAGLQQTLAGLGYGDVTIRDMDTLVAGIQQGVREVAYPDNWFVARVALGL